MKILTGVMNPIANDGRVQRATRVLAELGEVELLCPSGPVLPAGLPFSVRTVDLPTGIGSRFTEHLVFWKAFLRAARHFCPDLIYVHDHYLALAGAVAARISGARLVYDAHELSVPDGSSKMVWQDRAKYLFDWLGVRSADLVISTGIERARVMQEHYGLKEMPLVVRNIAEDMSDRRCATPHLERRNQEAVFVYEGHVALERGIQRYIQALAFLPATYSLVIIGGGPHLSELRAIAQAANVANRVRFTGRVPREDVLPMLQQCDVGLISYSWEGLNNLYCAPNKIFEYAQAGIPVVATAQPTLEAMIGPAEIGRTVSERAQAEDVAAVMREVLLMRNSFMANIPRFLQENRWETDAIKLRSAISGLLAGSQDET